MMSGIEYNKKLYINPLLHRRFKMYCKQVNSKMINMTGNIIRSYLKTIEPVK
jgi:hypothetical protein